MALQTVHPTSIHTTGVAHHQPNFVARYVSTGELDQFKRTFIDLNENMRRQDEQLLLIARSLDRTLDAARDINAELRIQGDQINRIEAQVQHTTVKMEEGSNRIRELIKKQKAQWKTYLGAGGVGTIAGVALVLILL